MSDQKFRFWAYDLLSGSAGRLGTLRSSLPFTTLTFTRAFNSAESWSASMPLREAKATLANMNPAQTAVVVERDGVILFVGIIWSVSTDGDSVTVGGGGYLSAMDQGRRLLNSRLGMSYATTSGAPGEITWSFVDQFRIVKDLVDHAAAWAGPSNVGFKEVRYQGVSGGSLSGITRQRTFWDYEKRSILQTMQAFTTIINGLDFMPNYGWDTTVDPPKPAVYLDLFYPRVGSGETTPKVTLIEDQHVTVSAYALDATGMANQTWAAGSGTADSKVYGQASDPGLRYPTGPFPMLEHAEAYGDIQEGAILTGHAQADLYESGYAAESLTVEARENALSVGTVVPGDAVRVVAARPPLLTINDVYRTMSVATTIDDRSQARIVMSCVTPGASLGYAEDIPE